MAAIPPPPNPPMPREEAFAFITGPGQIGEMEEKIIRGNKLRCWKNGPFTAREAFFDAVNEYSSRDYLVYYNLAIGEELRITYEQAGKIVTALANMMKQEYGVKKGTHVAISMRNYPEYLLIYWAVLSLGAITINVNAFLKPEEMEYCILDGDSTLLFVDGERARMFQPLIANFVKSGIKALVECRPENGKYQPNTAKYEQLLEKYLKADRSLPDAQVGPEDDAVIFYTSGTTGKPKGALSCNRAVVGGVLAAKVNALAGMLRMGYTPAYFPSFKNKDPQSVALVPTPLFHVTANAATSVPYTAMGYKIVLMYKWDATHALHIIQKEKVNGMAAVPSMHINIIEHPDVDKYDLSSVMSMSSGGAPAPVSFPDMMKKKFPNKIAANGWGMSETLIGVIGISSEDYRLKPTSIGFPSPVHDVRYVDTETGKEVEDGKVGELQIRGPQILKEYYKKKEATAKTITPDGWLCTGDLGRRDKEGFNYLVDRAKDMLIRGGENIYCVEVENCLYLHDAVMDAAVLGLPHRVLGEEVGAIVQLKPQYRGKVSEKDLIAHCKAKLAAFKCPILIQMRDEPLPRNPTGKITKIDLRKDLIEAATRRGIIKPEARL